MEVPAWCWGMVDILHLPTSDVTDTLEPLIFIILKIKED